MADAGLAVRPGGEIGKSAVLKGEIRQCVVDAMRLLHYIKAPRDSEIAGV